MPSSLAASRPTCTPRLELSAAEHDALQELGDEIATLAAHVHAATHRLLTLIAEFDRRRGWEAEGFPSCAHWLAFRSGLDRLHAWRNADQELHARRESVRARLAALAMEFN